MKKIEETADIATTLTEASEMMQEAKAIGKKKVKAFRPKSGLYLSFFLMALMAVVMSTNVSMKSGEGGGILGFLKVISLQFAILFFAQIAVYISSSDSGMCAGIDSAPYKEAKARYKTEKDSVNESGFTPRLSEFCLWYADRELKNARTAILSDVGISYAEYEEKWLGADDAAVQNEKMPDAMRSAICAANRMKRITLTPDMLLHPERLSEDRQPLRVSPTEKLKRAYIRKVITTLAFSLVFSSIAFDLLVDFNWASVSAIALKLMLTLFSVFSGYSLGYQNKAVDSAHYLNDQADLLNQFFDYCKKNPWKEEKTNHEIVASNRGGEGATPDYHDGRATCQGALQTGYGNGAYDENAGPDGYIPE